MLYYNDTMIATHHPYQLIQHIPQGKVTTYGILARVSGVKNPRVIGAMLHKNPDPKTIPCHRVVNWQGKVSKNYAFGKARAQIKKLQQEGVKVVKGRVDLKKYSLQTINRI